MAIITYNPVGSGLRLEYFLCMVPITRGVEIGICVDNYGTKMPVYHLDVIVPVERSYPQSDNPWRICLGWVTYLVVLGIEHFFLDSLKGLFTL